MSSGAASAPASSGNIGPGFDVLAIAFELRCEVTATVNDEWLVVQDGRRWSPQETELVFQAARLMSDLPLVIEIRNQVPRSRGLGSSSALGTAAAAASARANDVEPTDADLLHIVAELEGHADNAAAAVFGGLVMVDGEHVVRLDIADDLRFVVAVPDKPLRTAEARAVLPDEVGRAAVVRSLSRFGFLVHGLQTGRADVLARARNDELHEAARGRLSPLTGELMKAALAAGAHHASWSGAGPTALAVVSAPDVGAVVAAMQEVLGEGGKARQLEVDTTGWR